MNPLVLTGLTFILMGSVQTDIQSGADIAH